LQPVADKWNTGYQYTNTPTDLKAVISSGPYIVEELVEDQYVTLKVNELFNWGPKPQYERITVREIADSTAAVQAVENGDVSIASGQPTADVLALVQGLATAKYSTGNEASYEHIDLTVANGGPFDPAAWGGDEDKARAVRQAFLLTIPREQILENLIKPLNPDAALRNSVLVAPGFPGYDEMVAQNGSDFYGGSDADNLAKAQQLLADAGVTENIEVGFWYPEGNVRRGQEFELIAANAALAGFTVVDESEPDWVFTGGDGASNPHDAVIFAWASTSLAVTGSDQYLSAGPSNWTGFQDDAVDALLTELNTALDPARQLEIQIEVEKILWAEGYGTTIFQFPGLTWWDAGIDGVSSNVLVPYFFWNFWDWKPAAQ
jgi:peptide/nickel transport system substrate-binding protein